MEFGVRMRNPGYTISSSINSNNGNHSNNRRIIIVEGLYF